MATETRETAGLIGSDKVEGTAVYGADGNKIGSIEHVMLGKTDGRVAYAVLSFGGFLGIGDDHYPLPWDQLTYDTSLGLGVAITEKQLEGAPKYSDQWDWEVRQRARQVSDYYGSAWTGYAKLGVTHRAFFFFGDAVMITQTDVVVATGMPAAPALNWGAIIAGGVVAAVVTLILMLVGSGFGFTMVSPWTSRAPPPRPSLCQPRSGS